MRNRVLVVAAALVAAVVVALPATAAKKRTEREHDLIAAMSGQEEAPGPGDADGYGAADFRIKGNRICFRIVARNIAPGTAAHIHKAPSGQPGDIVVGLFASTPEQSKVPPRVAGCVKTTRARAKDIARHPGDYYVNVHNADFPGGAIRGQLSR